MVICVPVAKLSVCGTGHLLPPFVSGILVVVSTRGGGLGDRPPTAVVTFGWDWVDDREGGIGTGSTPGPEGVGFLFPVLPPDPELNPDATELVASPLARSDNEDSSRMEKEQH